MAKRPCLGVNGQPCRTLTDRTDHRCPPCASEWHRQRDARRGGTTARHYGTDHQATRARLLPHAYGTPCPRCGEPMTQGQDLDTGHPDDAPLRLDPTSKANRIEHATCNRGARD